MRIFKFITVALFVSSVSFAQDAVPSTRSTLASNVNLSIADYNNTKLIYSESGIAIKMQKFVVARDNLVLYVSEDAVDATMGLLVLFLDMFSQHVNAECDPNFIKVYIKPELTMSESCDAFKAERSSVTIKLLENALVFAEKGFALASASGDVASMAEFDKWTKKLRALGIKPSAWGKALAQPPPPQSSTL